MPEHGDERGIIDLFGKGEGVLVVSDRSPADGSAASISAMMSSVETVRPPRLKTSAPLKLTREALMKAPAASSAYWKPKRPPNVM